MGVKSTDELPDYSEVNGSIEVVANNLADLPAQAGELKNERDESRAD